ncbi:MAG: aspartate aminotransferase [Deltaproteobacteria bacterium RIFCSPLOWO2_02_FULL_53_8]|nr:MAG: aspartate aminotransferase [Deltaproteobacteria bacterium RIFCSPLOWO2_02_FULL_53_8]
MSKLARLADRLNGLEESVTLLITAKAAELRAQGRDIIGFGAGEPDFDTPDNIKEAAIKAIRDGKTKYTPVGGIPELKDAVRAKFRRDNALEYKREEVIVSCGGKHSIFNLFQAILDKGDEIIIPAPFWVSYPVMAGLAGATPVIVQTTEATGFKMTPEAFEAAITPATKAVVINSPSNPTGAAYTERELALLGEIALKKGVLVITDEIYEKLAYDGFQVTSIASTAKELKDNCIVLNGVSKAYAMTGWRIGYAAGPAHIIKAMTSIQSQSTSNPASISQWAAVEALNGTQAFIPAMVKEFAARRDTMVSALNAITGVSAFKPQGAFYVFANVSRLYGRSSEGRALKGSADLATWLLDVAGVAVVPGEAFGNDYYVRLSYATSMKNIAEGIQRFGAAVDTLK